MWVDINSIIQRFVCVLVRPIGLNGRYRELNTVDVKYCHYSCKIIRMVLCVVCIRTNRKLFLYLYRSFRLARTS